MDGDFKFDLAKVRCVNYINGEVVEEIEEKEEVEENVEKSM